VSVTVSVSPETTEASAFSTVSMASSEDDAVLKRIRVHERATAGARRLRKLQRDEAADILVVTAMLLGFEDVWAKRPRAREVRR